MTSKAAEVTAMPAGDCPGLAWLMRSRMLSTARYAARAKKVMPIRRTACLSRSSPSPLPGHHDGGGGESDH
jgi:hypothetical protein